MSEQKKFPPPHVLLPNKLETITVNWGEREVKIPLDFFKISGKVDALLECIREMDISNKHIPEVIERLETIGSNCEEPVFAFAIGSTVASLKAR